jgi:SAM-dependent methyltransferase
MPTPEALANHYGVTFYPGRDSRGGAARGFFVRRRVALLRRHVPPPGPVLDYGCGNGDFLAALAREGYGVEGVEPSEAGRACVPPRIAVTDSLDGVEGRSFAAVTLWHVLEHVATPLETLVGLRGRLAPGGLLLVAVPNAASPEARWCGPAWFHRDIPRHVAQFTPAALDALLARAGLRVVSRGLRSAEYNLFGAIQSAANLAPVEHNALYKVLKQGRSLASLDRRTRALVVGVLATLPAWTAAAAAWDGLQAVAGTGSTLTVLARPG